MNTHKCPICSWPLDSAGAQCGHCISLDQANQRGIAKIEAQPNPFELARVRVESAEREKLIELLISDRTDEQLVEEAVRRFKVAHPKDTDIVGERLASHVERKRPPPTGPTLGRVRVRSKQDAFDKELQILASRKIQEGHQFEREALRLYQESRGHLPDDIIVTFLGFRGMSEVVVVETSPASTSEEQTPSEEQQTSRHFAELDPAERPAPGELTPVPLPASEGKEESRKVIDFAEMARKKRVLEIVRKALKERGES